MEKKWIPSEPDRPMHVSAFGVNIMTRNDSDRGIVREVFSEKVYGTDIRPGMTVIDIGANIGCFSLLAAKKGARVYAFEPDPWNFRMLKKNILLNDFSRSISAFNDAVWSKKGAIHLFDSCSDNLGGHSVIRQRNPEEKTTVSCVTLDDIFRMNKIEECDFLKIDCEGAEYEILWAAGCLDRVKEIRMEVHAFATTREEYEKFVEMLATHFEIRGGEWNEVVNYIHAIRK